jgi:hypothetical protein
VWGRKVLAANPTTESLVNRTRVCTRCNKELPLAAYATNYKGRPFARCKKCYLGQRRKQPHYHAGLIAAQESNGVRLTEEEKQQFLKEQAERLARRDRDKEAVARAAKALQENRHRIAESPLPPRPQGKERRYSVAMPGLLHRTVKEYCLRRGVPVAGYVTRVVAEALERDLRQ